MELQCVVCLLLCGVLFQFLVARTQLFSPLNTFGFQQNILYSKFLGSHGGNIVYL